MKHRINIKKNNTILIKYIIGAFIIMNLLSPQFFQKKVLAKELSTKEVTAVLKKVAARTGQTAMQYLQKMYFVSKDKSNYPVTLTPEEWKNKLDIQQYQILRKKGTERAFTGKLDKEYRTGTFYSAATGEALFLSDDKFDSKTGWPSFTKPITANAVRYVLDKKFGITRIEVVDVRSGSHLGHVFEDGPAPTKLRYCMNSASLIFVPKGGNPPKKL